jgi:hypothetical protein
MQLLIIRHKKYAVLKKFVFFFFFHLDRLGPVASL